MRTIFRLVVMLAVGAGAVKGWRLYGPTNEQVKTALTQAIDMAQSAMHGRDNANNANDPRLTQQLGTTPSSLAPTPIASAPPLAMPSVQGDAPKLLSNMAPAASSPPASASPAPITPIVEAPGAGAAVTGDRMPQLMSKLQQLGAADTNLAPWGNDGHMYRFTCKAPLANAPAMTQHFESVAAEPTLAVEQVVAKVEAWRVAQRDGGQLRY